MRLGLLGNHGAALSAFQQAPLLSFHGFAQFTALAPGPGWRAGGPAASATGPGPAKRLLLPQLVLSQGPLSRPAESHRQDQAAAGGHLGWGDGVTLREGFQTVSFWAEHHRPYLLSCQAGTPH